MAVEIACGNCGKAFGVQPDWAGLAVQCPFCEVAVQVPNEVSEFSSSVQNQAGPRPEPLPPEPLPQGPASQPLPFAIDTGKSKPKAVDLSPLDIPSRDAAVSQSNATLPDSEKTPPGKMEAVRRQPPERKKNKSPRKVDNRWKTAEKPDSSDSPDKPVSDIKSQNPVTAAAPESPQSTKAKPNVSQAGKAANRSNANRPDANRSSANKKRSTQPTESPAKGITASQNLQVDGTAVTESESTQSPVEVNNAASADLSVIPQVLQAAEVTVAAPETIPVTFPSHPLAFPTTIWHQENLTQQVDVVVRSGVKQIEFHGEKVLIRDDENVRNIYQIAGFILSLIILVAALAWVTFR